MKHIFLLTGLISFSAFANCPSMEYQRKNSWRLYDEDQERELWSCKLTSSSDFSRLEFCVGRMTSTMPIKEYVGLAGIEQWKKEYYPTQLMSTQSIWISIYDDKEGEVTDTNSSLLMIDTPIADIMANDQFRYTVRLDKKTGKGSYLIEKKPKPCIFCGGWKQSASASLQCREVK